MLKKVEFTCLKSLTKYVTFCPETLGTVQQGFLKFRGEIECVRRMPCSNVK